MRFVVSSTDLLSHLKALKSVISTKNSMPILDNFLFNLEDNYLTITASDLETTLVTKMLIDNANGNGLIGIEAKRLVDILNEFSEQPLTFEIDFDTLAIDILSENGKYSVIGADYNDYPQSKPLNEETSNQIVIPSDILQSGISKTFFAISEDDMRPVMCGIYFELKSEGMYFVSTDAHKLVRYRRKDIKSETEASFILPKKPAGLLKNLLPREITEVNLRFDDKNAVFTFNDMELKCRLTEGSYPNYASVIPYDSPNKLTIDRLDFYNSLRRVNVFSNQASNLVKLTLKADELLVSAQDIDFSISAYEKLNCQYEGDDLAIGFKSIFLSEILHNISSPDVRLELGAPNRAGIVVPANETEDEDVLMLLMPLMLSDNEDYDNDYRNNNDDDDDNDEDND